MSSRRKGASHRAAVLRRLGEAGRAMSDAVILFHTRAAERFGLGVTDWKALGIIERSGPMTHRELVDLIGLKPASVTNMLDRLEARGWIFRARADDDGRRITISVNAEQLAMYREQVFGSLLERLLAVYVPYSDEELSLVARALEEIALAQTVAAEELLQDQSAPKTSRRKSS